MRRSKAIIAFNQILSEYADARIKFYREKILSNHPLKDIIQESLAKEELLILQHLIFKEFPQHKSFLLRYLILI